MLLAAGHGTRLRPLTESLPKCLVPIAGQPVLDYWVDLLNESGVREAVINTHTLTHVVRTYVDRVNERGPLRLIESHEPDLLGSAGTVAANASLADDADEVIVIYADNLSDVSIADMIAFHRSHDDPITMLLFHAPDPSACGIVDLDARGRVTSFFEKPARPVGDLANAGVYVMDSDVYREIAGLNAFDLGGDVLPRYIGRMSGWVTRGYHLDIGTRRSFERAQRDAPSLRVPGGVERAGRRPAVYLDRDGTLIDHVHYLSDADRVRLAPGGAEAMRRFRDAGFACVLVTNQSGVGRGMITANQLAAVQAELTRQLSLEGTALDGVYACTVVPESSDPTVIDHLDRKPGPGMLWAAARDLGLDVARSWMIGDATSDVVAGRNAGCAGSILIDANDDAGTMPGGHCTAHRVADLRAAARWILDAEPGPRDDATARAPGDSAQELLS